MKIAAQGVNGAFHYVAARQFAGSDIEIISCERFEQVFEAVEGAAVDRGIVAIDNSLYGSINDNYDLLLRYKPFIVGEVYLHINLCLLTKKDIQLSDITDVYSQAPALAEAKQFLRDNCPQAKVHEYPDTAMSARFIAKTDKDTIACIASRQAGELHNLFLAAEEIEDHTHNYTRFFIFAKHPTQVTDANKTTAILSINHKPGSLYRALGAFANNGINLSKIESRPVVHNRGWSYIFYIDFEAGQNDARTKAAVSQLADDGNHYEVLGSYVRGKLPNGLEDQSNL